MPNREDILFAKAVNDKLIATQTYNPHEIREAYRRLFGEEAPNQHYARSRVFAYFQYTYKAVDVTETANIESPSVTIDNQSHDEDEVRVISFNNDNETVTTPDGTVHNLKPKRKRNKKK